MENYFAFFGLPTHYHLDATALRRQYLQNSRDYHPDFHTLAEERKQREQLLLSSLNNEAYKTLSDPHKRLHHLLRLHEWIGEDGQATDGRSLPQDFLMEMMELNEAAEEAQSSEEAAPLLQKLDTELQQLAAQLAEALQGFDAEADETARKQLLSPVLDLYLKQKYLLRAKEALARFTSPNA